MPFGLTITGFVVKPTAQILADINAQELATISPSLDVQPTALIGIINGIFAAAIGELWLLAGALYSGMDPDQATGDQLTSLALITGTLRLGPTATIVICTINVGAGFSAAPGTMFASIVGNPGAIFVNVDNVPVSGGGNITGVTFEATQTGPIQALAGTLTVISQPLTGWNTITNPADGIVGHDIESDAQLRIDRNAELSTPGSSTADAIRADVLKGMQPPTTVASTLSVTVLFNDTDAVDVNLLNPHSIEVIAYAPGATAGDDQLLANLILASKAAGDGTSGSTSKVAIDSQGNTDVVRFTRPTAVVLTVVITVVTNPSLFPLDGATQIKNAMVAYAAATYFPGVEVFAKKLADQSFTVAGVNDYTVFTVNGGGNLPIGFTQIATLAFGGITVTVI